MDSAQDSDLANILEFGYLRLLCLVFLPKVLEPTFIAGTTSIPESRVYFISDPDQPTAKS